jgi:hypothetical protein
MSEYFQRQLEKLEPHYGKHVSAMTGEGLHSKSDIAAELAWRDQQIIRLKREAVSLYEDLIESRGEACDLSDQVEYLKAINWDLTKEGENTKREDLNEDMQ